MELLHIRINKVDFYVKIDSILEIKFSDKDEYATVTTAWGGAGETKSYTIPYPSKANGTDYYADTLKAYLGIPTN